MDGKKYQDLSEKLQGNFEQFNASFVSLKEDKSVVESKGMSQVILTTFVIVVGLIVIVSIWGVK